MANAPNSETRTVYSEVIGNQLIAPPRVSTIHATSYLSLSTNVTVPANLTAIVLEIANTLIAMGQWA
jgi:hypothetical protein